ncbi:permease [Actomonas aquatica]|uniref:Permease n=1 Tax=Actomonas aquatica TaxID=2866162 RepID=A0ABZ1C4B5_9BACT|nr:permease [Opitutus sp. WL0086]WRQ86331.1 permease [Opitutus sp. WL0086]
MWTWAEWIADRAVALAGWDAANGAGAALHFFVYDLLKIVVLVAVVAFIMALVRGALPLDRIRAALDRPGGRTLGYPAAALFGALTPFCSCSSVPVFLGFIQARFPIGVAFAFLIASPLVNEIAVALLGATFGWRFAFTYAAAGIGLGIVGGLVLTFLRADRWLSPDALKTPTDEDDEPAPHGLEPRLRDAAETSAYILRKIAPWLLVSLGLGAAMHGFVPAGFFENLFAGTSTWTVPLASLAGLPLYVSANATVPLLDAFVSKGVPLGTALAFLLSAVGVSFPELVLLRSVMTVRLLATFSVVVLIGTTLLGWLFNALH